MFIKQLNEDIPTNIIEKDYKMIISFMDETELQRLLEYFDRSGDEQAYVYVLNIFSSLK